MNGQRSFDWTLIKKSGGISNKNHFYASEGKLRSSLIEDGVLPWVVYNASNELAGIRRHIEFTLCHLAQNGKTCVFKHQFCLF